MTKSQQLILACLLLGGLPTSFAQTLKEVTIQSDTAIDSFSKEAGIYLGEKCFFLKLNKLQQPLEIKFYPAPEKNITNIQIIPSSDILVIDTLVNINNTYFRGKIKLKDPEHGQKEVLLLHLSTASGNFTEELKLLPCFETKLLPLSASAELYAGEEKPIGIPAINSSNIKLPLDWIRNLDFDYLLKAEDGKLNLLIHPNTVGNKELVLNLTTVSPFLNTLNQVSFNLEPYIVHFTVKPSRLNFINTDKSDFFLDNNSEEVEEVQVDQKKGLEPGKSYRVENQLESGGKLIAELYVKSAIGDNKMLCSLRSYSYHKNSDGYLYLKLSGDAKYITNFNVLPKPAIETISVLHTGEDWSSQALVHPGETVQIRIEGKGLAKAKFQFSNCTQVKQDSTRIFDDVVFYSFKIPAEINKKVVYVELNKKRTKYELTIRENQKPVDFDFISVNYGTQNIPLNSTVLSKPVMEPKSLKEINILFDRSAIDTKTLAGKQYLDFEFKIYNSKNDLIEDQKAENIVICPDEASVRGSFYDRKDCFKSVLNVNDYLLHKTYDLEAWWKIEISVKHSANKYAEPGFSRRIVLIKQEMTSVDFQASFPTGLLIKNFRSKGIGDLSELSFAFLAQMTFYETDAVQKEKPYKLGAGLLVLNILNLSSSNSQTDIGAVAIASILPLKAESKFNFPLYFGFGYMLKSNNWFSLIGPGVQFNF
jgi:hypothetical protein